MNLEMKGKIAEICCCLNDYEQLTKSNIEKIVTDLSDMLIHSGDYEVLEVFVNVKALNEITKKLLENAMPLVLDEADKHGGSGTCCDGVRFERKEVGVRYDFSQDEEYQTLAETRKAIDIDIKARETALKLSGNCTKTSTTSVVITFPK